MQEDQKFKVVLGYKGSLRPAWIAGVPISKTDKQANQNKQKKAGLALGFGNSQILLSWTGADSKLNAN